MAKASRAKYLSSLADEVLSMADRVRNLIGAKHWLTDGHHKESILRSVLARHLPAAIYGSRGFVVSSFEGDYCSTEQDILVIDKTKEAPLFDQWEVAIAFPHQVLGAISVKSQLTKANFMDAVNGLRTIAKAPSAKIEVDPRWYGMYFFNESKTVRKDRTKVCEYVNDLFGTTERPLKDDRLLGFNCLCCGRDIIVKPRTSTDGHGNRTIRPVAYLCDGLAPAVFIADLLDHVATTLGATDSGFAASLDGLPFTPLCPDAAK